MKISDNSSRNADYIYPKIISQLVRCSRLLAVKELLQQWVLTPKDETLNILN